MISQGVVPVVTVGVLFVGFALGWWWRGRHDREEARRLLERLPPKQDGSSRG